VVNKSGRTHEEAIEAVLLVERLKSIEDTTNYVVTAGSLSTGKDDTNIERFLNTSRILVAFELNYGHTVSVGEELFDFSLVSYRFGSLT
jgi:hypothetical protein